MNIMKCYFATSLKIVMKNIPLKTVMKHILCFFGKLWFSRLFYDFFRCFDRWLFSPTPSAFQNLPCQQFFGSGYSDIWRPPASSLDSGDSVRPRFNISWNSPWLQTLSSALNTYWHLSSFTNTNRDTNKVFIPFNIDINT